MEKKEIRLLVKIEWGKQKKIIRMSFIVFAIFLLFKKSTHIVKAILMKVVVPTLLMEKSDF